MYFPSLENAGIRPLRTDGKAACVEILFWLTLYTAISISENAKKLPSALNAMPRLLPIDETALVFASITALVLIARARRFPLGDTVISRSVLKGRFRVVANSAPEVVSYHLIALGRFGVPIS